MDSQDLVFVAVGFAAQLIDGAIGMAYGTFSMAALVAVGLPPVTASASVHLAQTVTAAVSALAHLRFRNIVRAIFVPLALGGCLGAVLGALVLAWAPTGLIRPLVAAYLALLGGVIVWRQLRRRPIAPQPVDRRRLCGLGFAGGFMDTAGGGGWGPLVVSSLVAKGDMPRQAVGSSIAAEWVMTTVASAVFLAILGWEAASAALGLLIGGLPAAPLGAWASSRLPTRWLALAVGVCVCLLAGLTIAQVLRG